MSNELKVVIISSVGTLFIALLSGYLSYLWGVSSQKKIYNHEMKLKAYSELIGYRQLLSQLFVSRFEAFAFSDYHEYRWKIQGAPKESLDQKEAIRWMHKSEDLVLEISRTVQNLFETVGVIRVLFRQTPELQELSDKIYNYKTIKFEKRPQADWSIEQLEEWKLKVVPEIQTLVEKSIRDPINNLTFYLEKELHREK